ncbi:hypothetical protein HUJ05_011210 [Dendroctonus ponderosae]|nr:hypothetical protein HUJ05_011210 [Dendroctonus ponderosae]
MGLAADVIGAGVAAATPAAILAFCLLSLQLTSTGAKPQSSAVFVCVSSPNCAKAPLSLIKTPRGSGTNGHVQRNWASVRPAEKAKPYKTEEELALLDKASTRPPNQEILDHERKRKIELKCAEFADILEEQGFSEEMVAGKVDNYRKVLLGSDAVIGGLGIDAPDAAHCATRSVTVRAPSGGHVGSPGPPSEQNHISLPLVSKTPRLAGPKRPYVDERVIFERLWRGALGPRPPRRLQTCCCHCQCGAHPAAAFLSVRETHQVAEAQQEKNARLREAFGISEYFVEGSSFDPERQAKEKLAASAAAAERERQRALEKAEAARYQLVRTPSPEKEPLPKRPEAAPENKRKPKDSSPSTPEGGRKKKKKRKAAKKDKLCFQSGRGLVDLCVCCGCGPIAARFAKRGAGPAPTLQLAWIRQLDRAAGCVSSVKASAHKKKRKRRRRDQSTDESDSASDDDVDDDDDDVDVDDHGDKRRPNNRKLRPIPYTRLSPSSDSTCSSNSPYFARRRSSSRSPSSASMSP